MSARTVTTMCPMNCHPTLCGMRAEIDDGARGARLLGLDGDPDNPDSRGFLCVRGRAAAEIIDNPKRLLQPLARDRRGGDGWYAIGWDDALDRIADRLRALPPATAALWSGHGEAASNYGTRLGGQLLRRFAYLHGAQWWHPAMICWGLGGFGLGLSGALDVNSADDIADHAELILLWGANLASQPNTAPRLKAARRRGATVITIDVRRSEAAAQSDQLLLIRPGSDAVLALALMHVIVADELYDGAFVAAHTLGFDALRAHLGAYTPERAAAATGLSAERIVGLARRYATTTPAAIVLGGSSMHKGANRWYAARAVACLPALTGQYGIPGGGFGPRHGAFASGHGLADINADLIDTRPPADVIPAQMAAMTAALRDGRVRALLLFGTDMLSSFADSGALADGLHRCELIVCHDLFMNDTMRACADIVLPATAWLEQLGAKIAASHLYLMDMALAPAGAARSLHDVLRGLAARLGRDDFFPWADDEALLDALFAHPATDYASVAELRAEGCRRALRVSPYAYPDRHFATPSGRIEFFSRRAQDLGLPPLPIDGSETAGHTDRDYPLTFCYGRTLTHFHAFYDRGRALPSLARHNRGPVLWLAPSDAAARGVDDGDTVRIYNARGAFSARARVTEAMPRGAVWMRDGWGGINRLSSGDAVLPDAATALFPFGVGQASFDARVDVCAAGAPRGRPPAEKTPGRDDA